MPRNIDEAITLLVIVAFVAIFYWRPRLQLSRTAHGTAEWASEKVLRAAGMFTGKGLLLGRTLAGKLIWLPRYCHILIVGATGSGKGVSFIIPWLMTYNWGSIFCFDTKGDLFQTCAAWLERRGFRVIRVAPFNGGKDMLNPLDSIGEDELLVDNCRALAESIVIRQGTEPDPHWNESAVKVICALLVFVCLRMKGEERNLNTVREIASDPKLLDATADQLRQLEGIPARMGSDLLGMKESEKERAGVLSTVNRHLAFLDSEPVLAAVAKSTFDPTDLRKPGTVVFLQIPPKLLEAQRGLLRCWVTSIIRAMSRVA